MNKHKQHLANLILLLVTLVWGATFTLTKDALASIAVFAFLSVRFVLATMALLIMVALSPSARRSFHRVTWVTGVGIGLVLFGTYAFQTVGLEYTNAASAGFLTGMSVVLVPIFGIPVLRKMVGLQTWVAAGVSLIGLLFLCGADGDLRSLSPQAGGAWYQSMAWGDFLVLICAVLVAMQILLVEKFGQQVDALALATVEIGTVTVCSIVSAVLGHESVPVSAWLHPDIAFAVLVCAWPATSFAYYAQNVFQKFTSAAQTAIIFSMEPVFAAIIAWMTWHQSLSILSVIGGLLILVGMILADPTIRVFRVRTS